MIEITEMFKIIQEDNIMIIMNLVEKLLNIMMKNQQLKLKISYK